MGAEYTLYIPGRTGTEVQALLQSKRWKEKGGRNRWRMAVAGEYDESRDELMALQQRS